MWTLAIDTTTSTASVALLRHSEVVCEVLLNLGTNHSATLLPLIDKICGMSGTAIGEMDLFVCTVGPGSFTGIRNGLSTMKGFAYASGKPVVGVSTLEALAWNIAGVHIPVCPMLDARKHQVYTALYHPGENEPLERKGGEVVTDVGLFLQSVHGDVMFLGDGAEKYSELIKESLHGKARFAVGSQNRIRASMVGILGEKKFHRGETTDPISLAPTYLRVSEAEAKMLES
jgi:tRNA threonylcarbamoyladenosine biosynthesis protein TsaB